MKKDFRVFCVLFLCSFISLHSLSQTKTVESGNMAITIPQGWNVDNDMGSSSIMSGSFLIRDEYDERIYVLFEMDGLSTPEYIMQYSIINNSQFGEADWGQQKKIQFLSYDACSIEFKNKIMGAVYDGKAIAFNDNQHSYGIIAMALPGYDFTKDPVINTFHLTGKINNSVSETKSTREQIKELIYELRNNFGQQISPGLTWDNLELHPDKDELTFTYSITLISKADLDEETLAELSTGLKNDLVNSLDEMAKVMKIIQRCKDEKFTFIIKVTDRDKALLCQYVITPKDYQ